MTAPKPKLSLAGLVPAAAPTSTGKALEISLAKIIEDPKNPRKNFDKKELEELAATIREHGVLQPITLKPADAEGVYMIRYGARRFRASGIAGKLTIPAYISDAPEGVDDLVRQVIENDQRSPLGTREMAQAVASLQALKLTQQQIADKLGRPRQQIALYAAFSSFPSEIQDLEVLGARTLHELNQAYGLDRAATLAFIAAADDVSPITQKTATDFARSLKAPPTPSTPVAEPQGQDKPTTPPEAPQTPPPAPTAATGSTVTPSAPQTPPEAPREPEGQVQAPTPSAATPSPLSAPTAPPATALKSEPASAAAPHRLDVILEGVLREALSELETLGAGDRPAAVSIRKVLGSNTQTAH